MRETDVFDVGRVARAYENRPVAIALPRAIFFACIVLIVVAFSLQLPAYIFQGLFMIPLTLGMIYGLLKPASLVAHIFAILVLFVQCAGYLVAGIITGFSRQVTISNVFVLDDTRTVLYQTAEALIGGNWVWRSSYIGSGIVVFMLGLAMLPQLGRMIRLDRRERRLLSEPLSGGLPFILELKSGLLKFLAGSPLALIMALVASLFLALATGAVMTISRVIAVLIQLEVEICRTSPSTVDVQCLLPFGWWNIAAMGLILTLSFGILPFLASRLVDMARKGSAMTAAKRLKRQSGPPLLFLRSFRDDQVELPARPPGIARFMLNGFRKALPLDYLLVEDFLHLGTPRALGYPEERDLKFRPFGSIREYIPYDPPGTPEDRSCWRLEITKLAGQSRKIIMVFDEEVRNPDKGVSWELLAIGNNPEWYSKTVFIAHPRLVTRGPRETDYHVLDRNRHYWHRVSELTGLPVPASENLILGMTHNRYTRPELRVATVRNEAFVGEYLMALRYLTEAGS